MISLCAKTLIFPLLKVASFKNHDNRMMEATKYFYVSPLSFKYFRGDIQTRFELFIILRVYLIFLRVFPQVWAFQISSSNEQTSSMINFLCRFSRENLFDGYEDGRRVWNITLHWKIYDGSFSVLLNFHRVAFEKTSFFPTPWFMAEWIQLILFLLKLYNLNI